MTFMSTSKFGDSKLNYEHPKHFKVIHLHEHKFSKLLVLHVQKFLEPKHYSFIYKHVYICIYVCMCMIPNNGINEHEDRKYLTTAFHISMHQSCLSKPVCRGDQPNRLLCIHSQVSRGHSPTDSAQPSFKQTQIVKM